MSDESTNSIDQAIEKCSNNAKSHNDAARSILIILVQIMIVLGGSVAILIWSLYFRTGAETSVGTSLNSTFSNTLVFALLAIFKIVFGVLMSVSRFHLTEASKAEHYEIGFMRVRVAANNQGDGFQTEVRKSLTEHAFSYQSFSQSVFKSKKVESPLPGHPTSDIAALVLDLILDKFDLSKKQNEETKTS